MTTAALKPVTRDIVVDEVFAHAPETIWKVLTDGELMARWLMRPEGFAPVVGTRFTYRTRAAGKWDGTIRCTVTEVVPNEKLVYAWQGGDTGNVGYGSPLDTVVVFTLARVAGGTRVRLIHSGFVLPVNDSAYRTMGEGWKTVVARIGTMAGDGH